MAAASIATLPRFVTFVGDNGRFLLPGVHPQSILIQLATFTGNDSMGLRGVFEVVPYDTDGFIILRSLFNSRYLMFPATGGTRPNAATFFAPVPTVAEPIQAVQVASDTVRLRHRGRSMYMYRAADDVAEFLADEEIVDRSRLIVGEPVLERRLLSVDYHLDVAEISDVTPVVLASSSVINDSLHVGDLSLTVEFSRSTETTFSNSNTVGGSVTATATMRIPFISEMSIELSAFTEASWQWGSTSIETTTVSGTFTVRDVAPGDAVMLQVQATRAKARVPFSYTQRDTLVDGRLVTFNGTDGIFEGVNVFHIEWVPTNIATGERLAGYLMEA